MMEKVGEPEAVQSWNEAFSADADDVHHQDEWVMISTEVDFPHSTCLVRHTC